MKNTNEKFKSTASLLKWIRGILTLFCLGMAVFSVAEMEKTAWLMAFVGWLIAYEETE